MNFTTTAPDRKTLVKTIAEHFELDPAYNGPPTFSYKVGDITIEDEKTAARLQAFLIEKGWMEPAPAVSAAETESDLVGSVMDIGCPLSEMTVLSLTNLIHIKSNSDWKFVHVYTDEGQSAPNMENAKEWTRLLQDCMDGKIDLILTQKVSNVSRKPAEVTFCARFLATQEHPIGIYFISEDIFTLASYYLEDMTETRFFPTANWKMLPDGPEIRGELNE